MRPADLDLLRRTETIAEEVLLPAAAAVDAGQSPLPGLELLAAEGLYGLAAPAAAGGPGVAEEVGHRVAELLAGGCLTTTFVWAQHHGVVRTVATDSSPEFRDRWLSPLVRGELRSGVALAGGVRPGPPGLRATAADGGWIFDGEAPWVTGWGLVHTVLAVARDESDTLVAALLDATETTGLAASEPLRLLAVQSSATVTLRFTEHFVPAERVVKTWPLAAHLSRDWLAIRQHSTLALGLVDRCCRLIGPGPLDRELRDARAALAGATEDTIHGIRAAISALATRATAALVTHQGARSIRTGQHAERLAREAMFLLVFGSRPAIRTALLRELGATD